ncbi:hypothetical protein PPYR_02627 [Photinus pyralis]|uniref:HTH CENPB-type domain-containing protein n=1 Tax=Photinus pyralis TaxID=7054 RepID=A0A5N4B7S4_PHOPY|nr:hypothetical protein PPYR_02627 [Photinus pyralis]
MYRWGNTAHDMARNYVRKTERKSWSSDSLKKALEAINGGSSIRKAGRDFNIPESTLRDQMKLASPSVSLGRKGIFTPQQEQEIVNHVIKLANLFYGVTPMSLRKIAFDFAVKNNIKHNFNNQKQLAGKDWLYLFIKRNPKISLRQPEGTSINRITSFNADEVKRFFSHLEQIYSKFHFAANRVYNCDETGISNVPNKSGKIYAARGSKQVGVATSGERGRNVTVMCCMNAAGGYIPPMFIYPRKRMSASLETGGPVGAIYHCSDNGWINQDLFLTWLEHFKKHAKPSLDDPVLVATMEKAESGFRCTGIFPLNVDRFTADDFAPAEQHRNISIACNLDESDVQKNPQVTEVNVTSIEDTMTSVPSNSERKDTQPSTSTGTNCEKNLSAAFVSIENIAPIPKKVRRNIKKGGPKKQHSQILTSTPIKVQLLEDQKKRESKAAKAAGKKEASKLKPKKVTQT